MLRGVPVRLLRQLSLFPCKKNVTWGENTMKSGCPVAAKVNLNSVPKMDLDLLICRGA